METPDTWIPATTFKLYGLRGQHQIGDTGLVADRQADGQWLVTNSKDVHHDITWSDSWLQETGLHGTSFPKLRDLVSMVRLCHRAIPIMVPAPAKPAILQRTKDGYTAANGTVIIRPLKGGYLKTVNKGIHNYRWHASVADTSSPHQTYYYYNQLAHITEDQVAAILAYEQTQT
jgi:hypothetical protein